MNFFQDFSSLSPSSYFDSSENEMEIDDVEERKMETLPSDDSSSSSSLITNNNNNNNNKNKTFLLSVDTNIFLTHLTLLESLLSSFSSLCLYVSWTVISELDGLKNSNSESIRKQSRDAITFLHNNSGPGSRIVGQTLIQSRSNSSSLKNRIDSNDDEILLNTLQLKSFLVDVSLLTNDVTLRLKAQFCKLKSFSSSTITSHLSSLNWSSFVSSSSSSSSSSENVQLETFSQFSSCDIPVVPFDVKREISQNLIFLISQIHHYLILKINLGPSEPLTIEYNSDFSARNPSSLSLSSINYRLKDLESLLTRRSLPYTEPWRKEIIVCIQSLFLLIASLIPESLNPLRRHWEQSLRLCEEGMSGNRLKYKGNVYEGFTSLITSLRTQLTQENVSESCYRNVGLLTESLSQFLKVPKNEISTSNPILKTLLERLQGLSVLSINDSQSPYFPSFHLLPTSFVRFSLKEESRLILRHGLDELKALITKR